MTEDDKKLQVFHKLFTFVLLIAVVYLAWWGDNWRKQYNEMWESRDYFWDRWEEEAYNNEPKEVPQWVGKELQDMPKWKFEIGQDRFYILSGRGFDEFSGKITVNNCYDGYVVSTAETIDILPILYEFYGHYKEYDIYD